ncbi:acetylhydrolase [Opitutaceae bacterium EW11]|nr:acetylhydrolase [Opitutaceae bacterium EW11]
MRPTLLFRTLLASAALAPLWPAAIFAAETAQPPIPAIDPAYALPATDDGLPGAGPIRRADWFQRVWNERRNHFIERAKQDRGALVFLGDSITQGWNDDFHGAFPGEKLANRGIGGDTTRGVLIRMKVDVLALKPKGIVLLIGTNDIEEKAEPEVIAGNVRLILDELTHFNPKMPIVMCEVFPSSPSKNRPPEKIKALNALYVDLVKAYPQVTLLDTWSLFAGQDGNATLDEFPDLLHPNDKGYARWVKALRPVLVERRLLAK